MGKSWKFETVSSCFEVYHLGYFKWQDWRFVNMADKSLGWKKDVDEQLTKDLELAAHAAYDNGCELSIDARLLFESHRYSRATALAILAEEEFSKAFTLKLSADNKRWDSTLYDSLRSHAIKQGLAEAVVNFIEAEKAKARWIGGFTSAYPDEKKAKEFVAAAKKRLRKPVKDHLKQDALYVAISKEGKIKSIPKNITREEAENSLFQTELFKINVDILFGDESALERFFTL